MRISITRVGLTASLQKVVGFFSNDCIFFDSQKRRIIETNWNLEIKFAHFVNTSVTIFGEKIITSRTNTCVFNIVQNNQISRKVPNNKRGSCTDRKIVGLIESIRNSGMIIFTCDFNNRFAMTWIKLSSPFYSTFLL